jgi:hypothetical protein
MLVIAFERVLGEVVIELWSYRTLLAFMTPVMGK